MYLTIVEKALQESCERFSPDKLVKMYDDIYRSGVPRDILQQMIFIHIDHLGDLINVRGEGSEIVEVLKSAQMTLRDYLTDKQLIHF